MTIVISSLLVLCLICSPHSQMSNLEFQCPGCQSEPLFSDRVLSSECGNEAVGGPNPTGLMLLEEEGVRALGGGM